jgi:glycosyltransferase involved in cell wall biosynthesis
MDIELVALFFKGPLWNRVEKLGIPAKCLNVRGAADIRGIARLYRHLKSGGYDIVHVHHIHPAISAIVGQLESGNVYTEHGGGLLGGDWKDKLVYRWFQGNYCRFIAISSEMSGVMTGANSAISSRVSVIHNGVDLEKIDSVAASDGLGLPALFNSSRYRVGIIGRLEPQKGVATFIEAAAALAKTRDDVVFPIIGEGSLRDSLERQVRELGLQDRVMFLGFRTDAISILKRFDVFLFTSDYEPFGLVVTEAMAAGVPVVALHRKGAIPEIIDDGVDGFVVTSLASHDLAYKVDALLQDEGLGRTLTRNARKKVERRFTMKANAAEVVRVYETCCARR